MNDKSLPLALLSSGFLLSGALCLNANVYPSKDWAIPLLIVGIVISVLCLMAVYSKTPRQ